MPDSRADGPLSRPDVWNDVADGYVEEILPVFSRYAEDALRLAALSPDDVVLDVATGPGTLALLAAPRVARVEAVDFAPRMLEALRREVHDRGLRNVFATHADGQALPFEDQRFDAAFSMFGLIFFPDQARGFKELCRVLKPGGRAVVSSWTAADDVPLLGALFDALAEHLPEIPFRNGRAPLGDEADLRTTMQAAGFDMVEVHRVVHTTHVPDVRAFWRANVRSSAPLVALRHSVGEERWGDIAPGVLARLVDRFGDAPVEMAWPALLAIGRC